MKHSFRSEIDARLSDLTFTGQAQVLRRIRSRRPSWVMLPKRTVVVVLALMLTLCGTAVALTLRYSARFDLIRHARGIISSTYGLTDQMIDLFSPSVEQGENSWTVRFTSVDWPEQMGEYIVTDSADGGTQAMWSHDGKSSPASLGDLSQRIWGPVELQKLIDLRHYQREVKYETNYADMTLEERAAIDAPLLALAGVGYQIDIAPEESDVQPEEALIIARQSIMDKYGIHETTLENAQVNMSFRLHTGEMIRVYHMEFRMGKTRIVVEMNSPSAEVTYCFMRCELGNYLMPEGDLSKFPEAMKEFVAGGYFEVLSPEDKAEVYRRFKDARISVLLPMGEYTTPMPGDLNEKAAINLAREGLLEQISFPEEAFALFGIRTAMLQQGNNRVWQVRFIGQDQRNHSNWLRAENLGDYTVTVAADGAVTGIEWSLADQHEGTYDATSFGQSETYSAAELPYVVTLKKALDEILSRYQPSATDLDMTLEDHAASDELMRQAGFNPRIYAHMIPAEGELTEQEAIAQARQVLMDDYGVTESEMDQALLETWFGMCYDLGDTPVKGWSVAYKGCGPDGQDIYTVFLNAVNGIIEQVVHDDATIGNG